MAEFGITKTGFSIKPFQAILEEKAARAREVFGGDIDLRSTSALRKILDISSAEDQELWKRAEQLYYSNFISTASGQSLDLLGEDVGVTRRFLASTGKVKLKLTGEAPGRVYHLPIGTLVESNAPVQRFSIQKLVSLSDQNKEVIVDIVATARGPASDLAATKINKINPVYAQRFLSLGGAVINVVNEQPTSGGARPEDDTSYRDLLLGFPRTLWTLEAVRKVVKSLDGVRDCRLFDPLGGVDVSLSKFAFFSFSQRRFGTQRLLATPYFFNVLVATLPGFLWESEGTVIGLRETIQNAIRDVRPISIFPNLQRADDVRVGIRARLLIKPGHDKGSVVASIKERLERRINALGLGNSVLYAEVLCDCMDLPGVVDVQRLHLRRCPPLFLTINLGRQRFQSQVIEFAVGENISLLPNEIPVFEIDSDLFRVEVTDR
jgi:Baseplate J-like protein